MAILKVDERTHREGRSLPAFEFRCAEVNFNHEIIVLLKTFELEQLYSKTATSNKHKEAYYFYVKHSEPIEKLFVECEEHKDNESSLYEMKRQALAFVKKSNEDKTPIARYIRGQLYSVLSILWDPVVSDYSMSIGFNVVSPITFICDVDIPQRHISSDAANLKIMKEALKLYGDKNEN